MPPKLKQSAAKNLNILLGEISRLLRRDSNPNLLENEAAEPAVRIQELGKTCQIMKTEGCIVTQDFKQRFHNQTSVSL
jgi:hypothetical protein